MTQPRFSDLLFLGAKVAQDPNAPQPAGGAPDSDQQFEQDFARMAFTAMEDRAGKLMPYVVAFELVQKEEDGTAAVGMFGIDVGGRFYYVPVFFRNGRVLGVDILLNKEQNVMLPLQEAQIAKLLHQDMVTLGEAKKVEYNQLDQPSLDFVARPPNIKYAGEIDFKGAYAAYQKLASDLTTTAPDLAGAVFSKLAGDEVRETEQGDDLKELLAQLGPGATNAVLKTAAANPDYLASIYSVYPKVDEIVPERYAARKLAGDLFLFQCGQKLPEGVPAEKLAEIRLRGWTLVDRRPKSDTSRLHEVDMEALYGSADKPGVYKVQLTEGRTEDAIVIPAKQGVAVISEDGSKSFTCSTDTLCVRTDGIKDLPSDKLKAVSSIKPNRKYILVHPDSCEGRMFECESVSVKDGVTRAKIWERSYLDYGSCSRASSGVRVQSLVTVDRPGKELALATENEKGRATLYVPSDWKVIELEKDRSDKREKERSEYRDYPIEDATDEEAAEEIEFKPGSKVAMFQKLASIGYRSVDLVYDGEFRFSDSGVATGKMSEKTAACHLTRGYGLGVADAGRWIAEAKKCRGRKVRKSIAPSEKKAQAQYNHPPMPVPSGTTAYGVPMQTDTENWAVSQTQSPEAASGNDPWAASVEPGVMLPQDSQNLAQQAADLGQRKLFDHATIGGLAKLYDVSGMVDQLIPKLKTAIDSLGRLLFLIQWKHDDFAERFGDEDTAELQALVRTVFRSFGDLVLQLEKTSVSDQERTDPLAKA